MIKFVRSHIFIVFLTVSILISGFFIIGQAGQVKAAGVDYNTMADQASTPDKQIASYAYYLALKDCISANAFNNLQLNGTNISKISDIFTGQSRGVKVGYIAEKIAIDTAGAAYGPNDIDGEIQCSTAAKAAFLLWGIGNSANITAELTGFGYTQEKSYSCLARYDPKAGTSEATGAQNWPVLDNITLPYTNLPYTNEGFTSDTVNNEGELDSFCGAYALIAGTGYVTSKGQDGAAYNWTEAAPGQWTATKDIIAGGFGRYIKGNIFETSYIASERNYAEPSLDGNTGITYYLNKYYFQDANICAAVNKGLVSEIQFVSGSTTNKYDQLEVDKIRSGTVYGPYKEVPIIEDATGANNIYGYNMTSQKAKDNSDLPLWVGAITHCNSVAESLIVASNTITDFIDSNPGSTLYSSIISMAGGPGTVANTGESYANGEDVKTCGSEVPGIGWLICPVLTGLTTLNDGMWGITSSLLNVSPLSQTNSDGSVSEAYTAWGSIRNIANVVFVIIFLVMIFSQISSAGISNYGIKKLLPRLIIGAILVNVSFLLIQIAVDLSNIVGSSLYNLITASMPAVEISWKEVLPSILGAVAAAGAAAGAITIATLLAGGTGTLLLMLLPVAAMGALALLAAVFTLVFRKAAIIILAIIAPLAIVASLLPNTESWFKKWKDEFIKMLMLYPLAAVVFGGSQFAAYVIVGEGKEMFNYIIGLVVLTLPLFSLPFLATKGGQIMSAAGGALNKLVEKARSPIKNFAKSYEDESRSKYLAGDPSKARTGLGAARQNAYKRFSRQRMTRESNTKTNTMKFGSEWANSTEGRAADDRANLAESQSKWDKSASSMRMQNSVEGKKALDKEKLAETSLQTLKEESGTRFSQSVPGHDALSNLELAKKQTTIDSAAIATHTDNTAAGRVLNETISKGKLQSSIDSADTEHRVAASADGKILNETVSKGKLQSNTDSTDTDNRVAASIAGKALHQALGETTQKSTQYKQTIAHDLATSATGMANDSQIGVGKILAENDTLRTNIDVAQSQAGHAENIAQGILKIRSNTEDNKTATDVETDASSVGTRIEQKEAEASLKAAKSDTDLIATEATAGTQAEREARLVAEGVDPVLAARLANTLHDSQQTQDINAMASTSAGRIKSQELNADLATGGAETIAAAGMDTVGGVTRIQAIAQSGVDKEQNDQITARTILTKSKATPSSLIADAKAAFQLAKINHDEVGIRSATQILGKDTGTPGKLVLAGLIKTEFILDNSSPIVNAVKKEALAMGSKSWDATIDKWATDQTNRKVDDVRGDTATYEKLSPDDYFGQSNESLNAAFASGHLNIEMGKAVRANPGASRLGSIQQKFWENISNGTPPPILPT